MVNGAKQLPDGWKKATLFEITSTIKDVDHKMPKPANTDIPYISTKDFIGTDDIDFENAKHISESDYLALCRKIQPTPGDILLSRYGTVGEVRRVRTPLRFQASYSIAIIKVLPEQLNSDFLLYFLRSENAQEQMRKHIRASSQPDLGLEYIRKIEITLPPLPKQERIVAKIEELFTQLEAGTSALAKVQAGLRRYKASVLKAAVEGQLFGDVGLGDNSLPIDWQCIKVREAGKVQLGRQRSPKHHQGTHMRPYLRVANVFEDRIDLSDVKEMNFTPAEYEIYKLEDGDILLNEGQSPEYLGRPAMYKGELPGGCFQNTLIRFQAFDFVDRYFALLVFRHYMHAGRFAQESQITTNMAHLSAGRFGNVEFPLPPLEEQRRIVAEVERRLSVARQVESSVEEALVRASRLRQAVLKSAFEGRLA
jgi:type I restriction enzyme, S subunit